MSKAVGGGSSEIPSRGSFEQLEEVEDGQTSPTVTPNSVLPQYNDLSSFVHDNGLQSDISTFRKAAQLLSGNDEDIDFTAEETAALRAETTHQWRQPKLLYFTILVCSTGAIEQGWAQTGMNGANLTFPAALGVGSTSARDILIVGLINCGIYASGGLWGAWLSEPLNNRLGRRGTIFVGSLICLFANLGSAASWSWQVLMFFRLLLGTGLAINSSTVSVFAAECAPAAIRGGLAVSWQMWTAFGVFIGFTANAAVYNFGPRTWRIQLAAPFIPVLCLVFMVYLCPESPAWYIKTGRYDLAYQSLCRLRNADIQAAKEIYASYQQRQQRTSKTLSSSSSYLVRIRELFTIPRIRHATMASYTVMLSQQLCGINIIAFYSSTIFSDAGFSTFGALIASCVFGFVNFLGAFPAVWTMDTLGRRSLLLYTLPFMALTMLFCALTYQLPKGTLQFGLLAFLIYLFCAEYSPGMGPVPAAYSAEVFPLSHREVGMSMAVGTANIWAAVLSFTFPSLLAGLGSEGSFELYAALNLLAVVLVFLFVRETKRKTLDELDEVFSVDMLVFIRFQVMEYLPWVWKRYVLRTKEVPPVMEAVEYRELAQDAEDEEME